MRVVAIVLFVNSALLLSLGLDARAADDSEAVGYVTDVANEARVVWSNEPTGATRHVRATNCPRP